jgi:hypothetical protein
MRVNVYVIDLEIPSRVKRWALRLGVPLPVLAIAAGVAMANPPLPAFSLDQPLTSAAMNAIVDQVNTLASQQPFAPPGVVTAFAGPTAPSGWLSCDGSAVSRTTYANLFAAIGTASGSGDGSTTFNLPDYRGMFLRGVDSGSGRDPDTLARTAAATGGNAGNLVGSVEAQGTARNGLGINDSGHAHQGVIGGAVGGGNIIVSGAGGIAGQLLGFGGLGSGNTTLSAATTTSNVALNAGDRETRPLNAYVTYIIKF